MLKAETRTTYDGKTIKKTVYICKKAVYFFFYFSFGSVLNEHELDSKTTHRR